MFQKAEKSVKKPRTKTNKKSQNVVSQPVYGQIEMSVEEESEEVLIEE
jgi:hypothetical protein